jgi:subtilisin family serine protease
MIVRSIITLALCLLVASSVARSQNPEPKSGPQSGANAIPGRLLLKLTPAAFQAGISRSLPENITERYGIREISPWINPGLATYRLPNYKQGSLAPLQGATAESRALGLQRIMVVKFSTGDSPEKVARTLAHLPGVEYAEPVYVRKLQFSPNDPDTSKLWYLDVIKAREAWNVVRADSSVVIGIVDTGIQLDHEDLKDAVWHNAGEMGLDANGQDRRTNGKDDDGNGLVDDWTGYDFAGPDGESPNNDPTPGCEWHGVHVAGTAGAVGNNGLGIVGIAFGAKLMAVKISDNGCNPGLPGGYEGILYAAKMGARIINCSWGGSGRSRSEQEVIDVVTRDYGALVIAAAGNDVEDIDYYPASYDGVLSVAAVRNGDTRADFSNYNYRVGMTAPGAFVYSTRSGGSYEYLNGTSMAAPMVSATAVLLLKQHPNLGVEQLKEALRATTDDISGLNPAYADKLGSGRLNVLRAVTTGTSIASARMISYKIIDQNGDGFLDPGEHVRIEATIKNILGGATGVSAFMEPLSHPGVTVDGSQIDLGPMASGQSIVSPTSAFQFTVPADIPANGRMVFRMLVQTNDRVNADYLLLPVNPTYLTTSLNRIAATFNSVGNIGYNGLDQDQGDGFSFGSASDLLFHGGLMIGTDASHVADVVRVGGLSQGTADGFHITKPYRLSESQDSSVETGMASFSDSHLDPILRVGVDVAMRTYEYRDPLLQDAVTVVYAITNTGGSPLDGLHCALYLDWDISPDASSDLAAYDAAHRLASAHDALNSGSLYAGAALLSNQPVDFYPINNYDFNDGVTVDFAMDKKWRMMSGGVAGTTSPIADISMVFGGGPLSIPPGETREVAFALMGAASLEQLEQVADRARAHYQASLGLPSTAVEGSLFGLQSRPNPFADLATITFTMPREGYATLKLYDSRGIPVRTILEGNLSAGDHRAMVDPGDLPQGLYVYELRTAGQVARGKMVRIGK